jgi:hypothetical protein
MEFGTFEVLAGARIPRFWIIFPGFRTRTFSLPSVPKEVTTGPVPIRFRVVNQ